MKPVMTEVTDEIASLIWSGGDITPDLLKNDSSTDDDSDDSKKDEDKSDVDDASKKTEIKDKDLDDIWKNENDEDDEDDEGESDKDDLKSDKNADVVKKSAVGRKPSNLISAVNKLIENGELLPFDDGDLKTEEDALQLLKLNLAEKEKQSKTTAFTEKIKEYSPQVQAVLHYAEQGAQTAEELMTLLGAMKEVEDAYSFTTDSPEDCEKTLRYYYKSKGIRDSSIEKQIKLLKDSGFETLKEEADGIIPEVIAEREQKVAQELQAAEERKQLAEKASQDYLRTIQQTLSKDSIKGIALSKNEKAKLYEAVANPKYVSINGNRTTEFVKRLEEMQFGNAQDYEHFMMIVNLAVDYDGFMNKLKSSVGAETALKTERLLRDTKKTVLTAHDPVVKSRETDKKTVSKGFKNPFN